MQSLEIPIVASPFPRCRYLRYILRAAFSPLRSLHPFPVPSSFFPPFRRPLGNILSGGREREERRGACVCMAARGEGGEDEEEEEDRGGDIPPAPSSSFSSSFRASHTDQTRSRPGWKGGGQRSRRRPHNLPPLFDQCLLMVTSRSLSSLAQQSTRRACVFPVLHLADTEKNPHPCTVIEEKEGKDSLLLSPALPQQGAAAAVRCLSVQRCCVFPFASSPYLELGCR